MENRLLSRFKEVVGGEFLQQGSQDVEVKDLLIDSRKVTQGGQGCFFALRTAHRDGHQFLEEAYAKGVRVFVVDRVLDLKKLKDATVIKVRDTMLTIQKLGGGQRKKHDFPVLSITGSNGKTIVKEWLFHILSKEKKTVKNPKSYNSQIGVALSLWQCKQAHQFGIFEAGISEPGEMQALQQMILPQVGLITNIGSAHDENFKSRDEKAKEKFLLFKGCQQLIYCKDDVEVVKQVNNLNKQVNLFSWSRQEKADLMIISAEVGVNSTQIKGKFEGKIGEVEIFFTDDASIENAIHCWAALLALGHDTALIKKGLKELLPVAMRLELKQGINNSTIINDSYSSDLLSLKIALDFTQQQLQHKSKTLILSDILESGSEPQALYQEVNKMLEGSGINKLIGIGKSITANAKEFSQDKRFYSDTESFLQKHDFGAFSSETVLIKGARAFGFERISDQLEQKKHTTVMEVNLSAVQHNLNYFKKKLKSGVRLMVMVKAYSYGAGAFEVANLLQFNKIDYLGVAYADEGISLRKAGVNVPIMVMNPDPQAYEKMIRYGLEPEIFNTKTLESFEQALHKIGRHSPYPIHLKIDTGMHRLGFSTNEVPELINKIKDKSSVEVRSVFSHLATSDEELMENHTKAQIKSFVEVKKLFTGSLRKDPFFHILNSAGILSMPEAQFGMVRLGLGLYGISPKVETAKFLREVSTLKTSVSQIRSLPFGSTVGYSRAGLLSRNSTVATIPIGYADGLGRAMGNGNGYVLIKGKKACVIGNVCMDMCMVDVTNLDVQEGDEVIVFGKGLKIAVFAKNMGTIVYEALTGISPRVKRIYFQE